MRISDAYWPFKWRPGGYIKSSINLFFWLALRTVVQIALVFELTHAIGASGYGDFVATLAVATLFTPLAGLGLYSVMVRDGARQPDAMPRILGAMLQLCAPASVLFGLIGVTAVFFILPNHSHEFIKASFILSEVTSASLVELLARAQLAQHHAQRYGAMTAGLVAMRLLALNLHLMVARPTVISWMLIYSAASIIYTCTLYFWAASHVRPKFSSKFNWQYLKEGAPFMLAILSIRVQAEVNKPILARIGPVLAGNFNIAQRALDVVALPLSSLQEVLSPRLFSSSKPLNKALLPSGMLFCIGIGAAAILWLAAPLIPRLLGHDFNGVTALVRALALLPAVQAMRNMLGVLVVATDKTHTLSFSYLFNMVITVLLNAYLIPKYGLQGAIAAAYLAEMAVCLILTGALMHHIQRARTQ